ncbi:MAG TPA: mechanosensitive ion channel domain-containing protein [Thermomicrobiales bacterium]|nr:mechanosensitive ion channel domain-containing protein [Thermomicrobiales bacterium]
MSDSAESVLRALIAAATVIAAAYLGFALLQWVARRYSDRYPALTSLIARARRPFRFLVGLIVAQVASRRIAHVHGPWVDTLDHGLQIGTLVALVWLAITAVNVIEEQILKNDGKKDRDPIDRRRFQTQITLLRRLIVASIVAIGVVAVLLTFPAVASLGTTLVASAGLISIVAGLAAQTSLTNVFAGIQLALSDTIRVGDVVVADTQSGTITQLTLTHVEMRLWDGRVLILPSVYFISEPFENWTRNRNQIGGSVFIDVDWEMPVDVIRQEVTKILEGSDLWDGRRNFVLVSNTTGATRQLQIGISAANTDDLFALQSLLREKVTEFLVEEHPESLVRSRSQALTEPTPPAAPPDDHHAPPPS